MYILDLTNIKNDDIFIYLPYTSIVEFYYPFKHLGHNHLNHPKQNLNLNNQRSNKQNSIYRKAHWDCNLFKFPSFSNFTLGHGDNWYINPDTYKFNCTQIAPCAYMAPYFIYYELNILLFGLFAILLLRCMCYKTPTKTPIKLKKATNVEIKVIGQKAEPITEEKTKQLEQV